MMSKRKSYTAQDMRKMEAIVASGDVGSMTRERVALMLKQAAEMREALSRILGIADHLQTRFAIPKFASEEISELKQIAESAISATLRNCDAFSKDEVLRVLDDRSFSKEDTIEWLYEEAKGEVKWMV